ncbi:oxidoreductase [Gordonia jinghuaiqii]|uniref:FAD-dependent monooxygenase n=1 Tax=Gordonia jinghuaiqii TaxID=2758710 RepID=A0A7D7QPQ2_9ACTN|nr:FAD-dependent monooxygenase [Gordonia jinghuaiqii]MCR5979073.1 oxidoreductase [Gordonia jinghuaiqii]QMT01606.1 FAD-dependent monooxygenase [Gordonia jinghuaiqii]
MKLSRIAVLGGGPGGLYAARLLKRSYPTAEVTVYEQGSPDTTFGFGVGLASRTQRNLRDADPASLDAIVAVSHPHEMSMKVGGVVARLSHGELLAIARTTLLDVLQHHAAAAGVRLEFDCRATVADLDADLIIAADGVNSATRAAFADAFQPHITTGEGLYLWCGTDFALPSAIFTPVSTQHGTFVAHAYPYAPDRSTFLIETDEKTWRAAGFDLSTELTAPADSDEKALDYLQEAFADTLEGHRLIGNRTRWLRFRTVTCERWHVGNVVLLGDAAHTAHYSIGSGTKLAMEDAIALDRAVSDASTLEEALSAYEAARRPGVEYLQSIAARSEQWWESFPERSDIPVDQLMIAYMTRAGKVGLERFMSSAPEVAKRGLADYAGVESADVPDTDVARWALERPVTRRGRTFAGRVAPEALRRAPGTVVVDVDLISAWGEDADRLVADASGCSVLWLTGAGDRDSVLTRLDLGERARRETGAVVVVEAPRTAHDDLVAGLVSLRTDLVYIADDAAIGGVPEVARTAGVERTILRL